MTDTVESVECEGSGQDELSGDLDHDGQSTERAGKSGRRNGQASSVGEHPNVKSAAKSNTGQTVKTGQNPSDLGLVDGQLGGQRTVLALRDKLILDLLSVETLIGDVTDLGEHHGNSAERGADHDRPHAQVGTDLSTESEHWRWEDQ